MTPSDDELREIIADDPSKTGQKRPMTQYEREKQEREVKEAVELSCAILGVLAIAVAVVIALLMAAGSISQQQADLQKRIEQGCVWQPVYYNRNDCVVPKEKK